MGATAATRPALIGSQEVADLLGVCRATVRRAAREGTLPGALRLRRRGRLYFSRDAIVKFAAGHPPEGAVEPSAPEAPRPADPHRAGALGQEAA
jgi:excisionase family DNA binding protein